SFPIRRQPQSLPRDSRRAFNGCGPVTGLAFIHPGGDVRAPVSGCAFPLFYSEVPMKSGRSLVDLARELERQLATKKDMVVPSSLMLCRTSEQGVSSIDIDE